MWQINMFACWRVCVFVPSGERIRPAREPAMPLAFLFPGLPGEERILYVIFTEE